MFDNLLFSPSSPVDSDESVQDLLNALNEAQRQAVSTTNGPLLILAGAGTGKTRVLTTRFAYILLKKLARPEQILAVTFTNKAAREMRERISTLLGRPVEGLWLGTFHALCARMLRRHAEYIGLRRDFTVLDADDQLRLLKQIITAYPLDLKRTPPARILNILQTWKDRALLPENLNETLEAGELQNYGRQIYQDYQTRLCTLNACDFGDLMLHMVTIFKKYPEVLAQYQKRFHYIMVDEYQDTNTIQYLWLRLLAKRKDAPVNIACVGDDDQSIYSWRGADIRNILQFEEDFPGACIVRLEKNYRSTPHILGAAAGLIAHNEGRLGKTLHTGQDDTDMGEPVLVINTPDHEEEARLVGQMIQDLKVAGQSYGQIAVLMRAGFQARAFEEVFMLMAIAYQVIGGVRFYERAEIRDATAYMRVLVQPADDLAFERIINMPKRGFGDAALGKLRDYASLYGLSLFQGLEKQVAEKQLKGRMAEPLTHFVDAVQEARDILSKEGHVVAVEALLEKSGYFQFWRDNTGPDAPGRLDNLQELLRAIGEFPTLGAFLEHIALVMDSDNLESNEEKVSIMTLHASKGLEFDVVFLPGWEEGIFPSERSLEENGNNALEEERRLAYVGLTRARKQAVILHAGRRRKYTGWEEAFPSRFTEELPENHITRKEPRQKRYSSFGRGGASPYGVAERELSHFRARQRNQMTNALNGAGGQEGKNVNMVTLGTRIRHSRYGIGTVIAIEGESLTVNFEDAGEKHIMAGYVEVIS